MIVTFMLVCPFKNSVFDWLRLFIPCLHGITRITEFNEPIFPSWLNPLMFTIPSHPVGGASILSPLSTADKGTPTQLEGLPLSRIALFTQCSA
jgi:hypothetical protein